MLSNRQQIAWLRRLAVQALGAYPLVAPELRFVAHADLHLDNALFWRDDVRIIDFDDCGFGYWLYDIAVSLWELRHRATTGSSVQRSSRVTPSIGRCRPEA